MSKEKDKSSSAGEQEENSKLQKELQKSQELVQEYLAGWQRAKADFINYKKEQSDFADRLLKFSHEDLIKKLLPVLDSFDGAIAANNGNEGFIKLQQQLLGILFKDGLGIINETGIDFDPKIHEAIEMVEGDKPHQVVEIVQKGYRLHERILRAAKVKINK